MKVAIPWIVFFVLCNMTLLAKDEWRTESPDKAITVTFSRESDRHDYVMDVYRGTTRLLSRNIGLSLGYSSLLWSPDSRSLAFSAGTPFLMEAYLLSVPGDAAALIRLPGPELGWDNFYLLPQKWDRKRLYLTVSGPHAGKADGYSYSGTIIIEITDKSEKARIVKEAIHVDNEQ